MFALNYGSHKKINKNYFCYECILVPLSENRILFDNSIFSYPHKSMTKVVILGDSGVGKSSIIERFINAKFSPKYNMTIGFNVVAKNFAIDKDDSELLVILDVAGESRFAEVRKPCYLGIEIVLAVCDLTSKKSLTNLEKVWLPEFAKYRSNDDKLHPKVQIIGNKCDLADQITILPEELDDMAFRISVKFPQFTVLTPSIITSAKDNMFINEPLGCD